MLTGRQMVWLYAGLLVAILGNAAAVWLEISTGSYAFAGNAAAIVVCAGAIWLLHNREKLRKGE